MHREIDFGLKESILILRSENYSIRKTLDSLKERSLVVSKSTVVRVINKC